MGGAALCAAWGEPARPGFPLGETGKGRSIPCCRRLFLLAGPRRSLIHRLPPLMLNPFIHWLSPAAAHTVRRCFGFSPLGRFLTDRQCTNRRRCAPAACQSSRSSTRIVIGAVRAVPPLSESAMPRPRRPCNRSVTCRCFHMAQDACQTQAFPHRPVRIDSRSPASTVNRSFHSGRNLRPDIGWLLPSCRPGHRKPFTSRSCSVPKAAFDSPFGLR